MKRILLCIVFSCLLAGAASAQLGIKPSSDEDLATEWLAPYIGKVDSVSGEQLKKLVELEIKIDKEFRHLHLTYTSEKVLIEKLLGVFALEEKLFPSVLSEKQMKQYLAAIQNTKDNLLASTQKKKKNKDKHLKESTY